MANIRLYQFPTKASPVSADIVYIGDSAAAFDEKQCTIAQLISAYPNLTSLAGLTPAAGDIVYTTGSAFALLAAGTSGQVLKSNGAAPPSWTTSTFPSTGGTAGNVLISDGTNYIASTSLWPNTVGSNGKFIISNGTSNGYSTSTIPSSAGATANKVLLSDGTNYVLSIPTFPNASATATKIITSDGTNWIASTALWVNSVGTAGKIIRSDGTTNTYTTSTFADTYGVSTILYASSANAVSGLSTANSSILVTDSGGVPSWSTTLPAFTTSSITFSPTTGGIVGTTTNDNAAAGKVGEVISSEIAYASAVSLTNNTTANVTSISLTAGDWDIYGNVFFHGSVAPTAIYAGINTTSATVPDNSKLVGQSGATSNDTGWSVPFTRASLSGTTTYYLVALAAFAGTGTACGNIYARRAR